MHHINMSLKTGKSAGSDPKKVKLMKGVLHRPSFIRRNNNMWPSAALQLRTFSFAVFSKQSGNSSHTSAQPALTPHANRQQKAL